MITIEEHARERSTYVFICRLKDENGDPATPITFQWTLTDRDGNVINSRERVNILVPEEVNPIVLFGDDLQILDNERDRKAVHRRLVVEATYDSTLGRDLPVTGVAAFRLTNFVFIE